MLAFLFFTSSIPGKERNATDSGGDGAWRQKGFVLLFISLLLVQRSFQFVKGIFTWDADAASLFSLRGFKLGRCQHFS